MARYNIQQIAAVAFWANRGYRIAIGTDLMDLWGDADDLTRESYMHGASFALVHDPSPAEQHRHWWAWNLDHGREHPNMIPWSDLDPKEQDKDGLFLANVRYMASR